MPGRRSFGSHRRSMSSNDRDFFSRGSSSHPRDDVALKPSALPIALPPTNPSFQLVHFLSTTGPEEEEEDESPRQEVQYPEPTIDHADAFCKPSLRRLRSHLSPRRRASTTKSSRPRSFNPFLPTRAVIEKLSIGGKFKSGPSWTYGSAHRLRRETILPYCSN